MADAEGRFTIRGNSLCNAKGAEKFHVLAAEYRT